MENRGKLPLSENRTRARIPAAARVGAASQNAPVGHPGLWLSLVDACSPALAGPLPAAGQLVPTRRLAPVDSESSPLSPSLGAQSALAHPSSPVFWLPALSSALPCHLAHLFFTLVDHSLASMRIFVLKLCFVSCACSLPQRVWLARLRFATSSDTQGQGIGSRVSDRVHALSLYRGRHG